MDCNTCNAPNQTPGTLCTQCGQDPVAAQQPAQPNKLRAWWAGVTPAQKKGVLIGGAVLLALLLVGLLSWGFYSQGQMINTNAANIEVNTVRVVANRAAIDTTNAAIGTIKTDVAGNKGDIATLKADVAANGTAIGTLKTDVASNKTAIEVLRDDMTALDSTSRGRDAGRVTKLERRLWKARKQLKEARERLAAIEEDRAADAEPSLPDPAEPALPDPSTGVMTIRRVQ